MALRLSDCGVPILFCQTMSPAEDTLNSHPSDPVAPKDFVVQAMMRPRSGVVTKCGPLFGNVSLPLPPKVFCHSITPADVNLKIQIS